MQHLHLCRERTEVILALGSFKFTPLRNDLATGNVWQCHDLWHALIPYCIEPTVGRRQTRRSGRLARVGQRSPSHEQQGE